MGVFICIGILVLLFLTAGITLLMGRGSFLVAGYNTATPEERAEYDEKKLCRSMGVLCMIISAMLVVMGYLGYRVDNGFMEEQKMLPFAVVFIGVLLSAVIIEVIYVNTRCKRK